MKVGTPKNLSQLHEPRIKVPAIYWRFSATRVPTLEWINGFKLTDTQRIREADLETNALIQLGVQAGLQQLLNTDSSMLIPIQAICLP